MTETTPLNPSLTGEFSSGIAGIPLAVTELNRKDFASSNEVRWCPGCGDYSILSTFQAMLPELGLAKENTVVVSGIGCSSRFPYYMNTYGFHTIHGRAPAIATGIACARPDLNVWVMTGDGDALSIGGNHLIHALRRNVNVTIIMFNNRIYGLTKGQYSPTSELGKVTKSSPAGSLDTPFNPLSLALAAEASFVARVVDSDRAHFTEVLKRAALHRGSSFIEVYQNCPIFNDGAFEALKGPEADDHLIRLIDGEPIRFGRDANRVVIRDADGSMTVADAADVDEASIVVHNPHLSDPSQAFALSRLSDSGAIHQTIVGVLRDVSRSVYSDEIHRQIQIAQPDGPTDLQTLITGSDTWLAI